MEIRISKSEKYGQEGKESLKSMNEENVLVLNGKKINNPEDFTRGPFFRYMQSLDNRVPKHIITLDEKYLRSCLELVYASAMREMSTLSDGTSSLNFKSNLSEFVNYFPLEVGIIGNRTIGTITRSKGGVNLPEIPLYRQSVRTENDIVHGRAYLMDATKSADDNVSTSSSLSLSSLQKLEKKTTIFESKRYNYETKHERHISVSSICTLSGRSSFSGFGNFNRGLLHCTWKAGLPRFIFALDDHNEIYITNVIKSETPNNDGFDYMYTFHTNEAYLVGKMRVSTSLKLCLNNSEIKETEYVLFGENERDTRKVQTSINHKYKKSMGLSKVFKTSHSVREKASSRYSSTNETPFIDLSTNILPNPELAAIVVKKHVCLIRQEPEVGGWGMNFLKKVESKNTISSTDPSPCDCFGNNGDCSTSTNIIIPADIHGGPLDGTGGPTSLVDRWRYGGKCDCGGWDIGCPISVLNSELSKEENLSQIDIRVAGLRDSDPVMKMVNIRDGLYVINFCSNLSALQSLSIAVSIVHGQTVQ